MVRRSPLPPAVAPSARSVRVAPHRCRARHILLAACAAFAIVAANGTRAADEDRGEKGTEPKFAAADVKFFEDAVRPLLQKRCFECHGAQPKIKGGLRLTSRAAVLKGGDTGPAADLAKPESSLILEAVRYGSLQMPPTGRLPQAEIDVLARWIARGLPWTPGDKEPTPEPPKPPGPVVDETTKNHWAFRRVQRPPVPRVKRTDLVATPIDAFLLEKLEAAGESFAAPASKTSLLRRVTYDLTGLPPTPDEVAAFLADDSPKAYENVVDRLLASPRHGEHWGRHWLDLVRYAESNSYERDNPKPEVWRYRDWVVAAFNADVPYDRFVREQLAGDELPDGTRASLVATGYYRLGIWDDEPVDELQALYDDLDDVVSTTGQVFLGLTVGCARCHDHKLDPLPQRDYYRFLAFFGGVTRYAGPKGSPDQFSLRPLATPKERQEQAAAIAEHDRRTKAVAARIAALEGFVRPFLSDVEKEEFARENNRLPIVRTKTPKPLSKDEVAEYERLVDERARLRDFQPEALAKALCVTEIPRPRETHVLIRGNAHAQGDRVEPGFFAVLSPPEPRIVPPQVPSGTSGRRLALADWIASPQNPLAARVLANRLWQWHFGRGLVRSSNNFGLQGTPPTHPELLDWLAAETVEGGWKLKRMHRLLVLSRGYRQSAVADERTRERDPANDRFSRFDMRRLAAEEVRDSILAVCGNLNLDKVGGPSIYPPIPAEVLAGQSRPGAGWGKSSPADAARRSLYVHVKRSLALPILESFDAADADNSCPVRFATVQPTQALGLLNSAFLHDQARTFAESARKGAGDAPAAQVRFVLTRVLQRAPTGAETDRGVRFLESLRTTDALPADKALATFCLLSLNLDEFLYLD